LILKEKKPAETTTRFPWVWLKLDRHYVSSGLQFKLFQHDSSWQSLLGIRIKKD